MKTTLSDLQVQFSVTVRIKGRTVYVPKRLLFSFNTPTFLFSIINSHIDEIRSLKIDKYKVDEGVLLITANDIQLMIKEINVILEVLKECVEGSTQLKERLEVTEVLISTLDRSIQGLRNHSCSLTSPLKPDDYEVIGRINGVIEALEQVNWYYS